MLTIYLIRHAKSAANARLCWTGQRDVELSQDGVVEQRALCQRFVYPEAEFYFSSPLLRCTQSFEIIYGVRKCLKLDSLKECSLGVLEGKPYTNLDDDPAYVGWLARPNIMLEGGESFNGFTERACTGFNTLLVRLRLECKCTAAGVMHGNVMRALLHRFADPSISHGNWPIPNGGLYKLEFEDSLKCVKVGVAPKFLFDSYGWCDSK